MWHLLSLTFAVPRTTWTVLSYYVASYPAAFIFWFLPYHWQQNCYIILCVASYVEAFIFWCLPYHWSSDVCRTTDTNTVLSDVAAIIFLCLPCHGLQHCIIWWGTLCGSAIIINCIIIICGILSLMFAYHAPTTSTAYQHIEHLKGHLLSYNNMPSKRQRKKKHL